MGRWRPSGFGMYTRSTGRAWYAPRLRRSTGPAGSSPGLSRGRPGLSITARSRLAVQPVRRLAESVAIVDLVPERRQRLRVVPPRCLSSPVERPLQGAPALCPDPGVLSRLPLGQLPSLHGLRCFGLCSTPHRRRPLFSRFLGTMELSDSLHPCLTAVSLAGSPCGPGCDRPGQRQGLPGPAHRVSVHARGLRPRQVGPSLALSGGSVWPSAC